MHSHKTNINGAPCPFCPPNKRDPWAEAQCILGKPIWMVIPPEGIHMPCPAHPEGHHVFGSPARWQAVDYNSSGRPIDYDSSKNRIIDYDSSRPWRTTGDTV